VGATDEVWLILCNAPDADVAAAIARGLVESRQAACVNIGAPVRSVYRWEGAIEEAVEVPIAIKTTRERYVAVEAAIRAAHPYQVPEIIAVPLTAGLADYLAWVRAETTPR
jgi:periplasmic divalent cation tolerance protein